MTTALETRHTPFYCGTQAMDWEMANCDNCHMRGGYTDQTEREFVWRCDIQKAKDEAYWGDGSISMPMAIRMGTFPGDLRHGWRCSELVPIEPIEQYFKRFERPKTKLAPIWRRLKASWEAALEFWNPWWEPEADIYGDRGRIPFSLAWSIAWGIHKDLQVRA